MIIDGVEYTEKELSFLRQYTCRTTDDDYVYGQRGWNETYKKFGINANRYSVINAFLYSGGRTLPYDVNNGEDLRELLDVIESLYSLACKYGSTHRIPKTLYREEGFTEDMVTAYAKNGSQPTEWVTDSFKSCSTNRAETDVFKTKNSHKLCIRTDELISGDRNIPFIDVERLLPSHYFSDEKEIIIPPFISMLIYSMSKDSSNDYEISLSNILKDPRRVNSGEKSVESLSDFASTKDNLSDSDLDLP